MEDNPDRKGAKISQVSAEQVLGTQEQPPVPQTMPRLATGRLIEYVMEKLFALCPEIDAGIVVTYE
ncbi:MAG: hypothetical protein ACM3MN_09275, partial [Nitrospirota bacterium]